VSTEHIFLVWVMSDIYIRITPPVSKFCRA